MGKSPRVSPRGISPESHGHILAPGLFGHVTSGSQSSVPETRALPSLRFHAQGGRFQEGPWIPQHQPVTVPLFAGAHVPFLGQETGQLLLLTRRGRLEFASPSGPSEGQCLHPYPKSCV